MTSDYEKNFAVGPDISFVGSRAFFNFGGSELVFDKTKRGADWNGQAVVSIHQVLAG